MPVLVETYYPQAVDRKGGGFCVASILFHGITSLASTYSVFRNATRSCFC